MASMRGSETQEHTLERLEQNRTRMASMRDSETLHVKLHKKGRIRKLWKVPLLHSILKSNWNLEAMEGAIAAFHSEVKLEPCT